MIWNKATSPFSNIPPLKASNKKKHYQKVPTRMKPSFKPGPYNLLSRNKEHHDVKVLRQMITLKFDKQNSINVKNIANIALLSTQWLIIVDRSLTT